MKKLNAKVLALGLALTVLSVAPAFAESEGKGPGGGKFDPSQRAAKLKEKLNLTDEQTAQIQSIFASSQEEALEKAKAHHEAVQAKINAVLNDEQKAKHAELKKEMKEKRGEWKENRKNWKEAKRAEKKD